MVGGAPDLPCPSQATPVRPSTLLLVCCRWLAIVLQTFVVAKPSATSTSCCGLCLYWVRGVNAGQGSSEGQHLVAWPLSVELTSECVLVLGPMGPVGTGLCGVIKKMQHSKDGGPCGVFSNRVHSGVVEYGDVNTACTGDCASSESNVGARNRARRDLHLEGGVLRPME